MEKMLCLLVDDEKEARDRMEKLLGSFEEIELLAAEEDPGAAIKLIIETNPDIVFVDVEMPRKSGFDVVNEVRNNKVNPKFIFVTAYNQYAIKAIKKGAFDYLLKPVDIDELKETIERFTEKTSIEKAGKKLDESQLTKREQEIVGYLVKGKTSKEIAAILFLSKNTVDTHRRNILEKTGLKSTMELLSFAYKKNLL